MMYLGVFATSAATVSKSFQYILKKNTHKHATDICSLTKKRGKKTTTVCFNSCHCTLLFRAFEREKTAE